MRLHFYCERVPLRLRLHIPLKRDDPVALDGGIAGISLHDKTIQILDVKVLFSFSIIKFERDVTNDVKANDPKCGK